MYEVNSIPISEIEVMGIKPINYQETYTQTYEDTKKKIYPLINTGAWGAPRSGSMGVEPSGPCPIRYSRINQPAPKGLVKPPLIGRSSITIS